MSRDAILARVRAALGPNRSTGATVRPAPPPSLATSGADAVARFRAVARTKGTLTVGLPALDALPRAVTGVLAPAGEAARAVRLCDPALRRLDWAGCGIAVLSGAAQAADATGVSRALAGIAETGTVVVASGPDNPTTLAFLPETHLVVLDRRAIVGTFEDANVVLRATYGSGLPRTINFVSGASRTADIGGRIVMGAHGPRRLIVFIVPETDQGAGAAP